MTSAEVVIYDSVITAWSLPGGMVWRWGFQKARRTATLAKANVNSRSGHLAASISAYYEGSDRDSATMGVSADTPYAVYVHEGTQGPIEPTQHKYLKLQPGGNYALQVDGQTGNPFLMDALETVIRTL